MDVIFNELAKRCPFELDAVTLTCRGGTSFSYAFRWALLIAIAIDAPVRFVFTGRMVTVWPPVRPPLDHFPIVASAPKPTRGM